MQVVSSRWTFFLKYAFPMLWIIFMGGVTVLMLISPLEGLKDPFNPITAKVLMISFYVTVIGLFYLLFMRTKWVAMDKEHIYVSNFLKSYKYTYDSVAKFEETNMFLYKRVMLHFHQKTKFGKTVFFIGSHYLKYFLEKHPEQLAMLMEDTAPEKEKVDN